MKKIVKAFFKIFIITSIVLILNKGNITIYAKEINPEDIRLDDVFENGDIINYDETFNALELVKKYISIPDDTTELPFEGSITTIYYDKEGNFLTEEYFEGPENYEEGTFPGTKITIGHGNYEYWKLYSLELQSSLGLVFVPIDYKKPEFNLSCTPDNVKINENATCTIKAKILTKLNNIQFSIKAEGFKIKNIKPGDFFKDLKLENNTYSLKSKSTFSELTELTEMTLVTFKISSSELKNIDIENNIKILNILYEDDVTKKTISEISSTVKQLNVIGPNGELLQNPNTGETSYILLYAVLIITIITSISLVASKKNNIQI